MSNWQKTLHDASPYLSLGMQIGMTMVACVVAGYFLDQFFGTTPWLILAAAIFGMVCIFVRIIHIANQSK